MALSITYDDPDAGLIDITGSVVYGKGNIQLQTKAEQGSVSTVTLTVDDPFGAYNFQGLRPLYFEDDEADPVRLATYWIFTKRITRGSYRTGLARTWALDLQDQNHILWQKVMAGNDTDRPEESDVERVQWLLSTGEAGLIGDTTTYVFTDDPVDMDANPDTGYNGQMFQNVIDDCAQQSGKNYFMLDVDDGGGGFTSAVWYGADSLDEFVSDASISNVLADVDGETVFWGNISGELDKDPSRIYSGVFANYDGGYTYQSNPDTIDDFANRDTTASWPNVKTHTKAVARAERYLDTLNTEEEVVTVTIYSMRPDQANVFRAGQLVHDVAFSHYPGWEDGRDVRIITKTLTDQAVGLYSMELELTPLPPVVPPPDCSMVLGGLVAHDTGHVGPATYYAPISVSPSSPSVYPSAVVLGMWAQNGLAAVGHQPVTLDDDFTQTHTNHPGTWNGHDQYPTLAWMGYHCITSGSPGDASGSWAGTNPVESYRSIAVHVPTAETSPANQGEQLGTGGVVTMDAPPTAGNLLIAYRYAETTSWAATPTGWTSLGQWSIDTAAPGLFYLQVVVKCADGTEGTSITLGNHSKTHWQFIQEWAIT